MTPGFDMRISREHLLYDGLRALSDNTEVDGLPLVVEAADRRASGACLWMAMRAYDNGQPDEVEAWLGGRWARVGPWSDFFGRSRLAHGLFTVKNDALGGNAGPLAEAFIDALQLPRASRVSLFEAGAQSWALLDGAAVSMGSYGFGGMPPGLRIIGPRALRLMCIAVGVRPPQRQLAGEKLVPAEADVIREFLAFRHRDPAILKAQAERGLFRSAREAPFAVRALLGDELLPPDSDDPRHDHLPATGAYGDAGFDRLAARTLRAAGISAAEAGEMRAYAFRDDLYPTRWDSYQTRLLIDACQVGMPRLRQWQNVPVPPRDIPQLIALGYTPQRVQQISADSDLVDYRLVERLRQIVTAGRTDPRVEPPA